MTSGALRGQTALVTGASRGIGAAVARALDGAGARVVLLARTESALSALARTLANDPVVATADVRDRESLDSAIRAAVQTLGATPDIVVNNAGAFLIAHAVDTSVAQFAELLDVNLTAPFAVVRTILPNMLARGCGTIVTIGSIADRSVFPGNAAYAAAKHGLRALHEVLRAETRGTGVRMSLVSPGPVDTALWDPVDPDNTPGFTPRASMLDAESVAAAVLFAVTAPAALTIDELRLSRS